jgi:hypothetical protein
MIGVGLGPEFPWQAVDLSSVEDSRAAQDAACLARFCAISVARFEDNGRLGRLEVNDQVLTALLRLPLAWLNQPQTWPKPP